MGRANGKTPAVELELLQYMLGTPFVKLVIFVCLFFVSKYNSLVYITLITFLQNGHVLQ